MSALANHPQLAGIGLLRPAYFLSPVPVNTVRLIPQPEGYFPRVGKWTRVTVVYLYRSGQFRRLRWAPFHLN